MYIQKTPGNTQSQSHEVWRTCGCTYIHIYTHMQIYIHMHIYIYTYIHLETLKVTLMKFGDVWFYIYMCIWIYVYAYIYIHTHTWKHSKSGSWSLEDVWLFMPTMTRIPICRPQAMSHAWCPFLSTICVMWEGGYMYYECV